VHPSQQPLPPGSPWCWTRRVDLKGGHQRAGGYCSCMRVPDSPHCARQAGTAVPAASPQTRPDVEGPAPDAARASAMPRSSLSALPGVLHFTARQPSCDTQVSDHGVGAGDWWAACRPRVCSWQGRTPGTSRARSTLLCLVDSPTTLRQCSARRTCFPVLALSMKTLPEARQACVPEVELARSVF